MHSRTLRTLVPLHAAAAALLLSSCLPSASATGLPGAAVPTGSPPASSPAPSEPPSDPPAEPGPTPEAPPADPPADPPAGFPATRDARTWPFAQDSIWNTPIGSDARYVEATIEPATATGLSPDEDIIIMRPDAPQVDVLAHDAGWDPDRKRCDAIVEPRRTLVEGLPVPEDFSTDPGYLGRTPNNGAAVLLPDARTVSQNQPFHRCGPGGPAVSQYLFPDDDLYTGDGVRGAHGGSGMSTLGGTVRVGELVPGGVIRHALKVNLWGKTNLHCSADEPDGLPGHRWPAVAADGGACDPTSSNAYGDTDPGVQMGTLLALPPSFDAAGLRTEPARILARALQDYGAYVVDNTGWNVFGIATEWGPDGRVTEELPAEFGIHFGGDRDDPQTPATGDFMQDVDTIVAALHYVDNNGPDSVGGGGIPRAPLAPPFASQP